MTSTTDRVPIARPFLDSAEERAVIEVLRSGWVSQGPRCAAFEQALADYVGVKFARGVNSGTSALHLALLSCGVGRDDEVIVPAATCAAALHPIETVGARPVPVDVKLDTFAIDPLGLEGAITRRTKAIIVAHLFGLAADIEAISAVARARGIPLIEDAAVALGARVGDRHVGTFGDVAIVSFHPRKTITTGEGGVVLTASEAIARLVSELRAYGASVQAWERHNDGLFEMPAYEVAGFNYKMTDIQAAIGLEQVKKLSVILGAARAVARRYDEAFSGIGWLQRPLEPPGRTHAYQSYVCLCRAPGEAVADAEARRNALFAHLAERGIASVFGTRSVTTFGYYRRRYGWRDADYPEAMIAERCSIALPIFPSLAIDQQRRVIDAIHQFAMAPA